MFGAGADRLLEERSVDGQMNDEQLPRPEASPLKNDGRYILHPQLPAAERMMNDGQRPLIRF